MCVCVSHQIQVCPSLASQSADRGIQAPKVVCPRTLGRVSMSDYYQCYLEKPFNCRIIYLRISVTMVGFVRCFRNVSQSNQKELKHETVLEKSNPTLVLEGPFRLLTLSHDITCFFWAINFVHLKRSFSKAQR